MNTLQTLVGLVVLAAPLLAQAPARTPELQKLEAFVGTWTSEGKTEASPLAPAGSYKGTLKGEWGPGGFTVLRYDEQRDQSGNPQRAVLVLYYDSKAKAHRAFMVGDDGSSGTASLSFGPDSMTWVWEIPIKEKRYTLRGTLKPLSADVREYEEAYSEDGKTWKHYFQSKDTRMK